MIFGAFVYRENLCSKRRANYLELKIIEIVKRRFPKSQIVSNIDWKIDNNQYETDLITFIDSHLLIIEAKSHKISKEALRGGPDRIKRHIKDIFIKPGIQSKRLEDRLNELILDSSIENDLRNSLPINLDKIQRIIRLSVSLDDFASLQSDLNSYNSTGWIPDGFVPCPIIDLADFETLFDFLEHPIHIIHYLQRRTELIGQVEFIGDELDLMAYYQKTLFNINIQNKNTPIVISGISKPIDNYYNYRDLEINLEKPKPIISKLFLDILSKLEERSTPGWSEIGYILNMFSPDDQIKLSKSIKKQKKIVNRLWKNDGHENIIVLIPAFSSEYALTYVLFKNENSNRKNEFIDHATNLGLDPNHVNCCLVIAKNIDKDDLPYHFIGIYKTSKA